MSDEQFTNQSGFEKLKDTDDASSVDSSGHAEEFEQNESVDLQKPEDTAGRKGKKKKKAKAAKEKTDEVISEPNQLMMGFYSNVKRKDVERFIRARAESKMSLKTAWYNIIKFEDGFAWELHDGGSGKGVLQSVIKLLDTEPFAVVKLSNETVKVTRRANHSGLVAFRVPDSDYFENTPGIEYQDNMKPVLKSGLSLFVTGVVFATLGILSIFMASMFKFVFLHENEPYQHAKQITELPISQISRLEQVVALDGIFIQSLVYKNGKWQVNTGTEEPQKPEPKAQPDPQAQGSSDTDLISLSRSIDNSSNGNSKRLPPEIEAQLGN